MPLLGALLLVGLVVLLDRAVTFNAVLNQGTTDVRKDAAWALLVQMSPGLFRQLAPGTTAARDVQATVTATTVPPSANVPRTTLAFAPLGRLPDDLGGGRWRVYVFAIRDVRLPLTISGGTIVSATLIGGQS